jgi:PKD repeat protein
MKALTKILPFFLISIIIVFTLSPSVQPTKNSPNLSINSNGVETTSYPPDARFTYAPPDPYVNGTVTFDASASTPEGGYIVDYAWDFGDGESDHGEITVHIYNQSGTYIVTLNVTDSEGLWCITSKPVTVSPVYGPTANFAYSPQSPFINQVVTFDASSSTLGWNGTDNPSIIEYRWDFGDNTSTVVESDPVITHIFRTNGTFAVTLNVTDTMGWWNTTSQNVTAYTTGLNLTIATNRPMYYIELDEIQIQGNLTLYGNPVADNLVALEIDSPYMPIIYRTLQTGTTPVSGLINITHAFLSDEYGRPVSNLKEGAFFGYYNVTVKNIGNETLYPVVTVNFYQNLYPFYTFSTGGAPVSPNGTWTFVFSFTPPSWVSIGIVNVYVSAFSNYPRIGGYPYCPERLSTFEVVDPPGTLESSSEITTYSTNTNGSYDFAFKLHLGEKRGTYAIYVNALLGPRLATNNVTITVKLPGDVNDDGIVNSTDLIFGLAPAMGSMPGDFNWNPNADFNRNGRIDSGDLIFGFAPFYGCTA